MGLEGWIGGIGQMEVEKWKSEVSKMSNIFCLSSHNSNDNCSNSLLNGCPLAVAGRAIYVFISQGCLSFPLMLKPVPQMMVCFSWVSEDGCHQFYF